MRWIAVSLATCLAVSVVVLGWATLTRVPDEQAFVALPATPKAEEGSAPSPTPSKPKAPSRSRDWPTSSAVWQQILSDRRLAPISTRFALSGSPPVVDADVVGHTVRYVLETDTAARFLKRGMSGFLSNFRFGVEGRPMVVRLMDGNSLAWAAGYDGVGSTWVRARPKLKGCGPISYAEGRTLPPASGVSYAPPCRFVDLNEKTVLR